jgi:hypothetical protein
MLQHARDIGGGFLRRVDVAGGDTVARHRGRAFQFRLGRCIRRLRDGAAGRVARVAGHCVKTLAARANDAIEHMVQVVAMACGPSASAGAERSAAAANAPTRIFLFMGVPPQSGSHEGTDS